MIVMTCIPPHARTRLPSGCLAAQPDWLVKTKKNKQKDLIVREEERHRRVVSFWWLPACCSAARLVPAAPVAPVAGHRQNRSECRRARPPSRRAHRVRVEVVR